MFQKSTYSFVGGLLILCLFSSGLLNNLYAKDGKIDLIENKGQWGHGIRYKADIPNGAMFLTNSGFVYNFVKASDVEAINRQIESTVRKIPEGIIHHHAYKVNFVGGNVASEITSQGFDKRSNYNNYFIGNDPHKWASRVGLYGKVKLGNIYNGIDLYVYNNEESKGNSLEYDFVVGAGVNPDLIQLSFDGVTPEISENGNLIIQTTVNKVVESAPIVYQEIGGQRVSVTAKYVFKKGILSFSFPNGYNESYPLIIDPQLIFATYSGATASNVYAYCTTYDNQGNLYAGGDVWSTGWPVTTGAFQTIYGGGGHEAGINKYSYNGTNLIYSTYFGGNSWDLPHAMKVNSQGELVLAGSTESSNLPVPSNAYQPNIAGGWDIFIAHFTADGTGLVGATYIGGSNTEPEHMNLSSSPTLMTNDNNTHGAVPPVDLAFDASGNIWVVSNTSSTNFPVTSNAQQSTLAGGQDGVIFKLNPACTQLLYSSFIGGNGTDMACGIIFNHDNNIVICGTTSSTNFPTTAGAYHTTSQGGYDGFVSIINPSTGAILNSTYIGTSATDLGLFLQNDCANDIYVMGNTFGNYPITPGAWKTASDGDVFVDKLSSDLSSSLVSTRLGISQSSGYSVFCPTSFLVDICGRTYVVGFDEFGDDGGLPVSPNALQSSASSFWFCALGTNFSNLDYATFMGLSTDHNHIGINRMDPNGFVYQSVCNSQAYPYTTSSVWAPSKLTSGQDILSFKFSFDINVASLNETTGGGANTPKPHAVRGCKSAFFNITRPFPDSTALTVHYTLSGNAARGVDYVDPGAGDSVVIPAYDTIARVEIKPLLVPNMPTGVRNVVMTMFSPCGCVGGSNVIAKDTIRIYDSLFNEYTIPAPPAICAHTEIPITAEIDSTLDYVWSPQALIPDPRPLGLTIHPHPDASATFAITVTQPGAPSTCPPHTVSTHVTVEPYPQITMQSKDTTVCIPAGDSVPITAFVEPQGTNYIYKWVPATHLRNNYSILNKFAAPYGTYHYTLQVHTPLANCADTDSMKIRVVPPFKIASVSPVDTTVDYGDTVQLNVVGNAVAWIWLPIDYLNDANLQSPLSRPLKSIQYHVTGIDQYGCRDTGVVNIFVKYKPNFFVPSAFSPNGDGINDVFKIDNLQFEKLLTFKIYNRNGQLVFNSKNIKDGWDGTFNNKPSPNGVYFYIIEVVLPNGEHQVLKGDVTLIR